MKKNSASLGRNSDKTFLLGPQFYCYSQLMYRGGWKVKMDKQTNGHHSLFIPQKCDL